VTIDKFDTKESALQHRLYDSLNLNNFACHNLKP
jgi:hypothetical protein